MNKTMIKKFFDSLADTWDDEIIRSQWKIDRILDIAGVTENKTVLDVACGTGVLLNDYIARKVRKCVAIDISDKMLEVARANYSFSENIEFICADAETFRFPGKFDCIVIYNALPHFTDYDLLFKNLTGCLNENGRLTIAHGMSREDIIRHHSGAAKNVSAVLPEANDLAISLSTYLCIDKIISDDKIYVVSGELKTEKESNT